MVMTKMKEGEGAWEFFKLKLETTSKYVLLGYF